MSIILLERQEIPEKNLVEKRIYKMYLSADEKKKFMNDLQAEGVPIDEFEVKMHVVVEMKKYKI